MDSMRDYLTSVLEPVNGQCLSIHGTMRFVFRTDENILVTSQQPDFSRFDVEGFTVNGVFIGEIDFNLTGLSQAFGGNIMRYEFLGDNTLRLTPIFPPGPDGHTIRPQPFILQRLSSDPDRLN
jgi:hypothetical protein